jgi:hypothetical protein
VLVFLVWDMLVDLHGSLKWPEHVRWMMSSCRVERVDT